MTTSGLKTISTSRVGKQQIRPQIGDRVTVKEAVTAWYSDYAGMPECSFEPGDIGIVGSVEIPYVTQRYRSKNDEIYLCVDFYKEGVLMTENNPDWRVGVAYSNVVLLSADAAMYIPENRTNKLPGER
jgi:hypothetical protein